MHRTWSAEEENDLRILYNDGYKAREVAEILNNKYHNSYPKRNVSNVRKKASAMNIKSKFYRKQVNGLYYCSHCKTYKELNDFRQNNSSKNKISNICRGCEAVYKRNLRLKLKYGDIWNKFNELERKLKND